MFIQLISLSLHLPRQYIEKTTLKGIKYKILEFNPMVLQGKVKPDSSRPDLLHPVSSGFVCVSMHTVPHAYADAALNFPHNLNLELPFQRVEITQLLFCSSTFCAFTYLCLTSATRGWYTWTMMSLCRVRMWWRNPCEKISYFRLCVLQVERCCWSPTYTLVLDVLDFIFHFLNTNGKAGGTEKNTHIQPSNIAYRGQ